MPDAFFQKKRKRSSSGAAGDLNKKQSTGRPSRASSSSSSSRPSSRSKGPSSSGRPTERRHRGGEQSDEDDDDFDVERDDTRHRYEDDVSTDEEREQAETPAEARVRMAKMYLEGLKRDDIDPEEADAAVVDQENIAHRLQKDVSEHSGKLHIMLSPRLAAPASDGSNSLFLSGGHRGPLTAAVATHNGRYIYTAAKDGNIFRWRMEDGRIDVLMPRRRKAGKASAYKKAQEALKRQQQQTAEAATEVVEEESEDEAEEGEDAEIKEMEMSEAAEASRSKSSGASRRKARRAAAAMKSAAETKGKGKSTEDSSASTSRHAIAELGPEDGHTDEVCTLAVSSDGKYLVSGGSDKRIGVWSVQSEHDGSSASSPVQWVKALTGHKDAISGLKFRTSSHELYTASLDRTLKLFDVDQLSYIETLFGHQESICSLDALRGEFAVTVGGRDRTARWWKIRDESQLVFRGGAKSKMRDVMEGGDLLQDEERRKIRGDRGGSLVEGSLECVAMVDENHFLTGGDSGAISLWSLGKKKPIYTRAAVHGFDTPPSSSPTDGSPSSSISTPRWVTSLSCLPYGDVFASGSWDGAIRLWALDARLRSFKPLFTVHAPGFVNSLQLFQPPRSSLARPVVRPELWRNRLRTKGQSKRSSSGSAEVNGSAAEEQGADAQQGKQQVGASTSTSVGRKESVPPILVAALGTEPRMGRWMKLKQTKGVRSGALILPLSFRKE